VCEMMKSMIIEIHKLELEDLIRARMESGGFENVEDLLMHALKTAPTGDPSSAAPFRPKQSLGQFLLVSPLRDSGLKLERRRDYPRPLDPSPR
jgi:hypothetical protein